MSSKQMAVLTHAERSAIEAARVQRTPDEWRALPVVDCACGARFYREHDAQTVCRDCMGDSGFYASDADAIDTCPGCGCRAGEGRTAGCTHPDGCGYHDARALRTMRDVALLDAYDALLAAGNSAEAAVGKLIAIGVEYRDVLRAIAMAGK